MKKALPIAIAVFLTFVVTENYIISHMKVWDDGVKYHCEIFGGDFTYFMP